VVYNAFLTFGVQNRWLSSVEAFSLNLHRLHFDCQHSFIMVKTIMNPVIKGFNPDPSVSRNGNDFFLATSSFEYFLGVPIYHSRDLVNWKLIGHALTRRSQLDMRTVEPGGGIWAPTLRWRNDAGGPKGRFYLATCKWDRYRPKTDVSL